MSWNWFRSSSCQSSASRSRGYSAAPAPCGERRQELGVVQRPLALPVAALDRGLGRVRAAVVLEVQLADDASAARRRRPPARRRTRRWCASPCAARPAGRATRRSVSSICRRRPAAAVAVAEQQQAAPRAVVVLVVARAAAQLGDLGRRRCRCRPAGSARAPREPSIPCQRERVVRRRVEAVPGQLLGQEAVDAGAAHDLRQLAVVAEHVGVPELAAAAAELALEEALAVQELAHERLARGQVAVGLDPGAADRHPLAGLDVAADPLVEVGVARRIQSYCWACEQANRNSG